jgi:hypothetical protein
MCRTYYLLWWDQGRIGKKKIALDASRFEWSWQPVLPLVLPSVCKRGLCKHASIWASPSQSKLHLSTRWQCSDHPIGRTWSHISSFQTWWLPSQVWILASKGTLAVELTPPDLRHTPAGGGNLRSTLGLSGDFATLHATRLSCASPVNYVFLRTVNWFIYPGSSCHDSIAPVPYATYYFKDIHVATQYLPFGMWLMVFKGRSLTRSFQVIVSWLSSFSPVSQLMFFKDFQLIY